MIVDLPIGRLIVVYRTYELKSGSVQNIERNIRRGNWIWIYSLKRFESGTYNPDEVH
jgi:predicted 2-oxoglutarate/Fe(II)-dependent dioxygenase YbiX